MTPLGETSAPLLAYRDGRLEMDGVRLDDLVERYGTPFFAISERRLIANYEALRTGLETAGVAVRLRYCAKANNEAGVLSVLARAGAEVLASHLAEVELALACGFPAARIAYQRPAPPAAEVAAVLAAGVTMVHAFRPEDIERYSAAAAASAARGGPALRVSLRLRPARSNGVSPLRSLNARLGLTPAEARAVARSCRGSGGPRVVALNVYVGTQQRGPRAFDAALRGACDLARELRAEGSAAIEEINLGGGVPSPSLLRLAPRALWARWRDRWPAAAAVPGGAPAQLEAFARGLAARYRAAADRAGLTPPAALALEPGRSIAGNAAVLVSRVVAREAGWLFLDASRNFLGESPLLFSRALLPLRAPASAATRFVHLSGGTLNTMDVLDLRRRLPPLDAGDALAFCDAGAYSISRASRYAGMAPPVLLLDVDGAVHTIRRAEGAIDLMAPMAPGLMAPGLMAPMTPAFAATAVPAPRAAAGDEKS